MRHAHQSSPSIRSVTRQSVCCLVQAMPRILFGSVVASLAARAMIAAVAWMNAMVLGHPMSWVAPVLGAIATGLLLRWTGIGGRGGGTGTDVFIASLLGRGERPTWQLALTKLTATISTVGLGGSGGLIGPALLVGAGLTPQSGKTPNSVHQALDRDRMVLAAGAAAAVAVLWGAPVASALLPCEVIHRQRVDWPLLPSALIGAGVGTVMYRLSGGAAGSTAIIPTAWFRHLVLVGLVAAVAAMLGLCLIAGLRAMERLSAGKLPLHGASGGPPWRVLAMLALGGFGAVMAARFAGAGVLGFVSVQTSAQWIAEAGQGWRDLGLAAGKIAATVATVGSGASGGVVGPALYIGAATGRGLATLLNGSGVLLGTAGMAGCLAAVSNVPFAAAVLIVEKFGPATLPYAVAASGVSYAIARRWVAYRSLED